MRTDIPGYVLEAVIGAGASSTVYRARQLAAGGRVVAVKRLRCGSAQRADLRREAEVLDQLDHPHVLRLLDVIEVGDGLAIALQYASGGSLASRLRRDGPLAPAGAAAIALGVARALGSAHRRGLVHRDVKPANILLTADGYPLLADFGLAAGAADRVAGTAGYLDPAVALGDPPGPRADVYSLGVVCYQALAGVLPFVGGTDEQVLAAACDGAHPPFSQAAPAAGSALAAIVERAMARDARRRFADGDELAAALAAAAPLR